ncbi:hypothetical protein LJR267_010340 [Paraburkholderia hospita]|uniref:carboxymuconolactone decarboxylase family protein n=1 Tax=Paraburkholderia hospita TaxID=169430 RepID=UPI003ECF3A16
MQLAQLAFYVNRTINNGLTRARALEVMTQLALYTGWSTTFTALPIVKSVVDKRRNQVFRSKSPRSDSLTIVIGDHRLVTR